MRALGSQGRAGPPGIQGGRGRALQWRRAVGSDIPALSAFLRQNEESRVGFAGRLLRNSPPGPPILRLPSPLRGAVWVMDGEGASEAAAPTVIGAVLCHPSRLVFPIFPDASTGREAGKAEAGIALLTCSFSPASIIGMAADVDRYEAAIGAVPDASIVYCMMNRPEQALPTRAEPYPGVTIRRASAADLDALLPLQEAYEREEVLTRIHSFNQAACKASLARALERQIVFAAEEGGVIVAKAGTNARGFTVDQIGGVYTLPARRGRGLGYALMVALLEAISEQGRTPALFVKPINAPARALYRGLGFQDIGDYRADYFDV